MEAGEIGQPCVNTKKGILDSLRLCTDANRVCWLGHTVSSRAGMRINQLTLYVALKEHRCLFFMLFDPLFTKTRGKSLKYLHFGKAGNGAFHLLCWVHWFRLTQFNGNSVEGNARRVDELCISFDYGYVEYNLVSPKRRIVPLQSLQCFPSDVLRSGTYLVVHVHLISEKPDVLKRHKRRRLRESE